MGDLMIDITCRSSGLASTKLSSSSLLAAWLSQNYTFGPHLGIQNPHFARADAIFGSLTQLCANKLKHMQIWSAERLPIRVQILSSHMPDDLMQNSIETLRVCPRGLDCSL